MTTISWKQDEKYRYTALVKDYVLVIEQPNWPVKDAVWQWTIFGGGGEYRILSSWFDDDNESYDTADEAKAAAEKALNEYLTQNQTA